MSAITRTYVRLRECRGQTMAEYAMIVLLVAVVTVAAWGLLGVNVTASINSVAGKV